MECIVTLISLGIWYLTSMYAVHGNFSIKQNTQVLPLEETIVHAPERLNLF